MLSLVLDGPASAQAYCARFGDGAAAEQLLLNFSATACGSYLATFGACGW